MQTRRALLATLALALASACANDDVADVLPDDDDGSGDLTQGVGVTCVGSEVCSGEGDVYTSSYRVGASASARSDLLQTFVATTSGAPSRVSLVLRRLRAFTSGIDPLLHVEIFPVADPARPVVAGLPLLSGTKPVAEITPGVATIAVSGTGTLQAGSTYALVLRTDGVDETGTGLVLLGVGAKIIEAYGAGAAHRRGLRRATIAEEWSPSRFRPAGDWDVAFAFAGGPGSPCAQHAECSSSLRCLEGACGAANPVSPTISPSAVTLEVGSETTFTVSGGNAPFTYAMTSGGGSLSGAVYTAPATAGSATVRVTDVFGRTSDAAITINEPLPTVPERASCRAWFDAGERTSGPFRIDPDGPDGNPSFDAFCDHETDGGGWTLVARILGTSAAHRNTGAAGSLASPTQGSPAKYADALINTLRGNHATGLIRLDCASTRTYFQENKAFDAYNGSGAAILRCANAWNATTWYQGLPYASHYGLNTWQSGGCHYAIYYLADREGTGCYVNGAYAQSGAMWVK